MTHKCGDRVRHKVFGKGEVVDIYEYEGTSETAVVMFDSVHPQLHNGFRKGHLDNPGHHFFFSREHGNLDELETIEDKAVFKETKIVYTVLKCSGASWPQQERLYGVCSTKEKAEKLQAEVQRRHPNDHISVLEFGVDK